MTSMMACLSILPSVLPLHTVYMVIVFCRSELELLASVRWVMWSHVTWWGMAWHDVAWRDVTWSDMTWHDVMWHDLRWHDVTWHVLIWHDMTDDMNVIMDICRRWRNVRDIMYVFRFFAAVSYVNAIFAHIGQIWICPYLPSCYSYS